MILIGYNLHKVMLVVSLVWIFFFVLGVKVMFLFVVIAILSSFVLFSWL